MNTLAPASRIIETSRSLNDIARINIAKSEKLMVEVDAMLRRALIVIDRTSRLCRARRAPRPGADARQRFD